MISKREEEQDRLAALQLEQNPPGEQVIIVDGVPIPLDMAAKAVARCITAVQIVDRLIVQGFASEDDLRAIRAGLAGEDQTERATA